MHDSTVVPGLLEPSTSWVIICHAFSHRVGCIHSLRVSRRVSVVRVKTVISIILMGFGVVFSFAFAPIIMNTPNSHPSALWTKLRGADWRACPHMKCPSFLDNWRKERRSWRPSENARPVTCIHACVDKRVHRRTVCLSVRGSSFGDAFRD